MMLNKIIYNVHVFHLQCKMWLLFCLGVLELKGNSCLTLKGGNTP